MKNLKTQASWSLLFSMLFFTLNLYSAAKAPKTPKAELNSAFPVLIPQELDSVFPVLTKAALYIAERIHINLIDCETISICCGPEDLSQRNAFENLSPRNAFIGAALSALYNGTSREIFPNIKVLLLELGHTAAAERDEAVESQIKRCIEHISYMQNLIDILPDKLPKKTINSYIHLHIIPAPETPTQRKFMIADSLNEDNEDRDYGFQIRTSLGAFGGKEHAIKTLWSAKKQLEDYLADPELFTKSLQVKKEEKPSEYIFF